MRLLVSVRNAREAERAVRGGAAIVDAKEPGRGAIGRVDRDTLAAIRGAVPEDIALSAALGDVATGADVLEAMAVLLVPTTYVKLAFRHPADDGAIEALLATAVDRARRLPGAPGVIAVAYADHRRAGRVSPDAVADVLPGTGAAGLLIDTCFKDDGNLFRHIAQAVVGGIANRLTAHGLTLALGGSLGLSDLFRARETGAQILGVRGGACVGGRNGEISEQLVRQLAGAVEREKTPVSG